MLPETQEYYNIAGWLKDKINYNRISKFANSKRRQVLHGFYYIPLRLIQIIWSHLKEQYHTT